MLTMRWLFGEHLELPQYMWRVGLFHSDLSAVACAKVHLGPSSVVANASNMVGQLRFLFRQFIIIS